MLEPYLCYILQSILRKIGDLSPGLYNNVYLLIPVPETGNSKRASNDFKESDGLAHVELAVRTRPSASRFGGYATSI